MSQVGHDFPNSPCSGEFTSPSLLSSRTRSRCLRTAGSPCSGEFISPPSPGGSPGLFLEAPGFKPGVSVAKKGERRLQARGTNHQSITIPKFPSFRSLHSPSPPKHSTASALLFTLILEGYPACPDLRGEPRRACRLGLRLFAFVAASSPRHLPQVEAPDCFWKPRASSPG